MKHIFRFLVFILSFGLLVANAGEVSRFSIKFKPEKAKVGESLDMTIEALDKNNNVVTDYKGKVLIFSTKEKEVKLPISLKDSSYQFTDVDQGKIKFENGVMFSKPGIKDMNVYDSLNDNISGQAEIEITESEEKEKLNIDILSPETGLTIAKNKIKVSGSTNKNHKVVVTLNGKEKFKTTSNTNGIYEVEVDKLKNGENQIVSEVLNSEEKVVGKSKEISIKVDAGNIVLKKLKVIPEEVFSESVYEIEVLATEDLAKAQVIINDEVVSLKEIEKGKYNGKSYAPKKKGSYNVDVILTDNIGHEVKEIGAGTIKVKELNAATPPKEPKKEEPIVVTQVPETRDPLKITGLKLVELKTKSILTWDKLEKAKSYNIYKRNEKGGFDLIDTVTEAKYEVEITDTEKITYDYFAVKAIGETKEGKSYEGDLSDATKIKTGPAMLILIIIALFISGLLFVFNIRKNA